MKKVISVLLALIFVLSMGTMALADTKPSPSPSPTTPTYTDVSTVTIHKTYEATNTGTTSPAETFNFTIENTGVTNAASGVTVNNMPTPTIGSVSYSAGEAGSANKTKDVTVTLPDYPSVGVYTYTIKETAGNTAGVTYRTSDIKLVVTVIEQNGLVRIAAVHTEGQDGEKSDTFSDNTYSAGSLEISKTVTGIMGDKTKYFKVTVTLNGETGKTYARTYTVAGGSKIENGTDNCTSSTIAVGTPKDFYIKNGETLEIENVPYGVTYTVDEADYSEEDYTATGEVTTAETVDAATETVSITNDKGGTVDTGVIMDNLPFIVIAVLAVAGMTVIVSRKRSAED